MTSLISVRPSRVGIRHSVLNRTSSRDIGVSAQLAGQGKTVTNDSRDAQVRWKSYVYLDEIEQNGTS